MAGQKQHVDMFRKVRLRRELLQYAVPGAAYVPFCGDGDLVGQCYYKKPGITRIYAADLNPERVQTFGSRYPADTHTAVGDCDKWLFADDLPDYFSVGDFDAYAHPYASFLTWWNWAQDFHQSRLNDRLVLFFTDGHRQGIIRGKVLIDPENVHHPIEALKDRRRLFNFYPKMVIQPWFVKAVEGWKIEAAKFYLRAGMIYWGAVISRNG